MTQRALVDNFIHAMVLLQAGNPLVWLYFRDQPDMPTGSIIDMARWLVAQDNHVQEYGHSGEPWDDKLSPPIYRAARVLVIAIDEGMDAAMLWKLTHG